MKRKIIRFALISVLIISFTSCHQNRLDVDISNVSIPKIEVQQFEKDFFALRNNDFNQQTNFLKNKYGNFYEHYLINFLDKQGTADSNYKQKVTDFISDNEVNWAYSNSEKIYTKEVIENLEAELNDAAKRFHYYFPEKKLPKKIITCLSGWNFAFAQMDSALILALDMYLGDTCALYQMLRYPQYQTRKMNKENLVNDAVRGWMLSEFDKNEAGSNLLSHTIFYGKLFYTIKALLPQAEDSLVMGYNGKQMDYCKKYEKQLWSFFADKNRLFENNLNTIRELTSDGPFTGAIHKECPPRIAMWVGWQIVKSYIENNESVTLKELMINPNSQEILNKSKYRP